MKNKVNRKLKITLIFCATIAFLLLAFFVAKKDVKKGDELRIGFVTDIEYSLNRKIGSKLTKEGLTQLSKVKTSYNNQFKPDLVVAGGDYVRVSGGDKEEYEKLFSSVRDMFGKIKAKKVYLTGGIEEEIFSHEEVKDRLGFNECYGSRKVKGVRVITLDMKGRRGEGFEVKGKLNEEELVWLKKQIAKGDPTIIFSHFSPISIPLKDGWRDDFKDEESLVEAIQDSDNVLAVISGNSPVNYAQKNFKVPYINVASLVRDELVGNNLQLRVSFKDEEFNLRADFPNGEWFTMRQKEGERRSSKLKTSKVTKYDFKNEQWKFLGGKSSLDNKVSEIAGTESNLVFGSENKLFVAYQDEMYDNAAHVRVFDGERWSDLGQFSNFAKGVLSAKKGGDPNMTVRENQLFVGFVDKQNDRRVKVLKWDSSNWRELADGANPKGFLTQRLGHEPILTFDRNKKNLYVAFSTDGEPDDKECEHSCKVQVKKWNGFYWQNVGGKYATDNLSSEVDIVASKKSDDVFIAYQNHSDKGKIHVQRWDGKSWTKLSDNFHRTDSATDIAGFSPALTVDENDNLYLVYTGFDFDKTYITRWNGANWEKIGTGMVSTGRTAESTVAIDGKHLVVAFSQLRKDAKVEVEEEGTEEISYKKGNYWRLRVVRWNGEEWENLPSNSFEQGFVSVGNGKADPSMLIKNGKLFVSFTDAKNENATRVAMYDLNKL